MAVYTFLFDWQTLIAGLLALLGAWLTVRQIQKQITQTDASAEKLRSRNETAAKAVLPLALSEISEYARRCMALLGELTETPGKKISADCMVPALPQEVIVTLQDSVRFANDDIQKKIAVLLGKIQIQRARLVSFIETNREDIVPINEGVDRIIDAADVYVCNDIVTANAGVHVGSNLTYRTFAGRLPPGKVEYQIEHPGQGMHKRFAVELAFEDARGLAWVRRGKGHLERTSKDPLAFYEIDPPVSWLMP